MFNNREVINYCNKKKINPSQYDLNLSIISFGNKILTRTKKIDPNNLSLAEELIKNNIELTDHKDKITTSDFLSDLEKIKEILQNKETIDVQLEQLEHKLKNSTHSLMVLLYQWGTENGFSDQWIKITDIINQKTFFTILKDKQLMKDYGPHALHGEFSHVLQIYMIGEANKKLACLKNSIADIYARLGQEDCKSTASSLTVWDLLVDRKMTETCPAHDARCPERFMMYIESQSEKLSFLSGALRKKYVLTSIGVYNKQGHMNLFDKKNKLAQLNKKEEYLSGNSFKSEKNSNSSAHSFHLTPGKTTAKEEIINTKNKKIKK